MAKKKKTMVMWSRKDEPYFGDFRYMFWSINEIPPFLKHKFFKVSVTIKEL